MVAPHDRSARRQLGLVVAFAAVVAGCGGQDSLLEDSRTRRYSRTKLNDTLAKLDAPGLVIGEFRLARKAVVDGDTIKVEGLDTSLRLLAIDTEETFKSEKDRRAYEAGWESYVQLKGGGSAKPAKYATPLGEDAKHFAQEFFAGVDTVRLERDHPADIRGRFGRYLSYVLVQRDGQWINYNVECVRAGMSPYFTKYGYSRRFHDEFVAAQDEARAARRGIWAPDTEHYPDYEVRLAWWNTRAEFVRRFERDAGDRADFIELTQWDALKRIEEHIGKEVEVLATVGDIRRSETGPTRVMLSRRLNADFPLIFFDREVLGLTGIARHKGEFVRVRGVINEYRNKHTGRVTLQIIVELPGQIVSYEVPGITDAPKAANLR